jgi:hypothetical protein
LDLVGVADAGSPPCLLRSLDIGCYLTVYTRIDTDVVAQSVPKTVGVALQVGYHLIKHVLMHVAPLLCQAVLLLVDRLRELRNDGDKDESIGRGLERDGIAFLHIPAEVVDLDVVVGVVHTHERADVLEWRSSDDTMIDRAHNEQEGAENKDAKAESEDGRRPVIPLPYEETDDADDQCQESWHTDVHGIDDHTDTS